MKKILSGIFIMLPFFIFAQSNVFDNANVSMDYGYNIYEGNQYNLLDGITWGGRFTKILPSDEYNAFHLGLKASYHSRNEILDGIGQVKRMNGEIGVFFGWNDVGNQTYISGRYSFFTSERCHLLGMEVRIEPFDRVFHPDFELMFYGTPHFIVRQNAIPIKGITLGIGVTYHFNKKETNNIFNPENFYD